MLVKINNAVAEVEVRRDVMIVVNVLKGRLRDSEFFKFLGSYLYDEENSNLLKAIEDWKPAISSRKIEKTTGFSGREDWILSYQDEFQKNHGVIEQKRVFHSTMSGYTDYKFNAFIPDLIQVALLEDRFRSAFISGKSYKNFNVIERKYIDKDQELDSSTGLILKEMDLIDSIEKSIEKYKYEGVSFMPYDMTVMDSNEMPNRIIKRFKELGVNNLKFRNGLKNITESLELVDTSKEEICETQAAKEYFQQQQDIEFQIRKYSSVNKEYRDFPKILKYLTAHPNNKNIELMKKKKIYGYLLTDPEDSQKLEYYNINRELLKTIYIETSLKDELKKLEGEVLGE